MILEKEREQVVEYCRLMQTRNLTRGTGGNVSVYDRAAGLIAISPSGVEYSVMQPEDVVIVDTEGRVRDGRLKPSSETGLHLAAYEADPSFTAVVHTHSPFATAAACRNEPVPPVHYLIALGGSNRIPCIPYYPFGSPELAEAAGRKFREEPGLRVMLLGNHGLLSASSSLPEAFSQAEEIEFACELYLRLLGTGGMCLLAEEQMKEAAERFKGYGQV